MGVFLLLPEFYRGVKRKKKSMVLIAEGKGKSGKLKWGLSKKRLRWGFHYQKK